MAKPTGWLYVQNINGFWRFCWWMSHRYLYMWWACRLTYNWHDQHEHPDKVWWILQHSETLHVSEGNKSYSTCIFHNNNKWYIYIPVYIYIYLTFFHQMKIGLGAPYMLVNRSPRWPLKLCTRHSICTITSILNVRRQCLFTSNTISQPQPRLNTPCLRP